MNAIAIHSSDLWQRMTDECGAYPLTEQCDSFYSEISYCLATAGSLSVVWLVWTPLAQMASTAAAVCVSSFGSVAVAPAAAVAVPAMVAAVGGVMTIEMAAGMIAVAGVVATIAAICGAGTAAVVGAGLLGGGLIAGMFAALVAAFTEMMAALVAALMAMMAMMAVVVVIALLLFGCVIAHWTPSLGITMPRSAVAGAAEASVCAPRMQANVPCGTPVGEPVMDPLTVVEDHSAIVESAVLEKDATRPRPTGTTGDQVTAAAEQLDGVVARTRSSMYPEPLLTATLLHAGSY